MQLHSFWVKYFLNRSQITSYLFAAGVVIVVLIAGLPAQNTLNNSNNAKQERYHRLALVAISQMSFTEYQQCSFVRADSLVPETFVLAVATVENYGRPPLRRWLEEILAKTNLLLLGKVPDYSLGLGQLKLSTAKIIIQQKIRGRSDYILNDSETLQVVLNPCENLKLVHEYLNFLMKEFGFVSFNKTAAITILRRYNGQQDIDKESQTYQEVVWEVFCLY